MRALACLCAVAAAVCFVPAAGPAYGQDRGSGGKELVLFFSPTCHECQVIKEDLLPRLSAKYGSGFTVVLRDISEMDNFKRLFAISRRVTPEAQDVKVPSVYFAGTLLVGGDRIRERLETLITQAQSAAAPVAQAQASFDPFAYFKSFTPLAVIVAGLVDGINPCAFTVIVFFVSFLALQGFRKRHLALIGAFFIAGVFITYLLIGLGLFGLFYKLSVFWQVRTALNWGIGGLSIFFGAAAVADAVKYKKTGTTDGMLLSLPRAVKNRIHAVIGMRYRGNAGVEDARVLGRLAATAMVTGFLVSLLEAVCTGQMYLPTIIFVLKSAPMKLAAFAYLVVYNFMFIVPLAVVLLLAVLGISSGQFARFMGRHFLAVKTSMALSFFALGIFLLWRG